MKKLVLKTFCLSMQNFAKTVSRHRIDYAPELLQYLDLLVSDTWLDTGIGYWYRYPMTRYYERLLDTRSS